MFKKFKLLLKTWLNWNNALFVFMLYVIFSVGKYSAKNQFDQIVKKHEDQIISLQNQYENEILNQLTEKATLQAEISAMKEFILLIISQTEISEYCYELPKPNFEHNYIDSSLEQNLVKIRI